MRRRKGLIGWAVGCFAAGIFATLFLFIFLYSFKYHITMIMVDYYFWNKEYDIPLALFSTDVDGVSSIVAMNKVHYDGVLTEDYKSLKTELNNIVESWFGEHGIYILRFEGTEINRLALDDCVCYAYQYGEGFVLTGQCTGPGCGGDEGKKCKVLDGTLVDEEGSCGGKRIARTSHLGTYPLPIVFNGTDRIIALELQVKKEMRIK